MKRDLHAATAAPPEPQSLPEKPATDARRRGFFAAAMQLGFAALGVCGGLWAAMTGRFLMPNALAEPARKFKAGFPADYPPGYVEGRFCEAHGVWIVHAAYQGRRRIFALRTLCTHLGCIVIWQENQQKFKCPCHGSGFLPNGINIEGPAPRPLERLAIRVAEDGQLEVDTSRLFQEELGQWSDPDSYVVA